jgi:hypothetical protein
MGIWVGFIWLRREISGGPFGENEPRTELIYVTLYLSDYPMSTGDKLAGP